ncbi:uncharacterized protein LOC141673588 [Apium graveolens]|uniref:uncharacterized protein LOC141673588 n=1 Tax=Apium graveolens TaxID=4045 RepID=UPI003D7BBC86
MGGLTLWNFWGVSTIRWMYIKYLTWLNAVSWQPPLERALSNGFRYLVQGITSWEQMKTLFLTQFQVAVKYTPPVTTLANVKEKEGESLTSYFKRFNAESTLARGATDETLKILLIAGLRMGTDFWKHLQGKDPVSLADVLAQAESFKAIEQSLVETKKNDNTHNSKGRTKRRDRSVSPDYRRNARSPNRVNTVNTRREWRPPSNYERRVSNYTPLAASIDHIFEVNKDRGVFKKPDSLTSWQSRDKEKYCDYHESTGHDIHEYRHLKDEIKELIKAGYLGEWIDKDNGSSANILYYSTYKKLGFPDSDIYFEDAHVYGVTGDAVRVMGSVRLPVTLGEGALSVTQMIDFKVLDQDSAHNVLVGRPWLRAFRVITSIHHLMIKFPMPNRVGSLRGSQYESRDCYHKAVKEFCRRRYEGKGLPFEDA